MRRLIPFTYFRFFSKLMWGLIALLALSGGLVYTAVSAQEASAEPRLFITGSDTSSAPTIQLRAYGIDTNGLPVDFSTRPLTVNHGDQTTEAVTVTGRETIGTFTIFLVDTPLGVQDQLGDIQEAILQYASPNFMQEATDRPVDYVAIYQVGATQAEPLLPATEYHNSVINFFNEPLPTESGPTALIDSLMGLLNNIDSLKPNPDMFASIVVFSDGTDAVSTQFQGSAVPGTAATAGVPIYTVTLNNSNIGLTETGSTYMRQIAIGSGGIATQLNDIDGVNTIWQRIVLFRDHTLLQYTVPELTGGQVPIALSLTENPLAQAGTTVSINATQPFVTFDIPAESRTLILTDVENPVTLKLPLTVGWVDGESREVTQAQLLVNGEIVADLDPAELTSPEVTIPNLAFGVNRLEVALADAEAQRVSSEELLLTVTQGEEAVIPELLQASGRSVWGRILLGIVITLFALAAILWLLYTLRSWPPIQKLGLERFFESLSTRPRRKSAALPVSNGASHIPAGEPVPPTYRASAMQITPQLEVLDAMSNVISPIQLSQMEVRIGRSSANTEIAFPNDITVSRMHASLIREGKGYRIFDENSTSGTLVNGEPVQEYGTLLLDGDEILLGAVRLRYGQSV